MNKRFFGKILVRMLIYEILVFIAIAVLMYLGLRFLDINQLLQINGESFRNMIVLSGCGLIIGLFLTVIGIRSFFEPIHKLIKSTEKITEGKFEEAIIPIQPKNRNSEIENLIVSFNSMVKELSSNEILRTDFINNVSHEFKTPLAAIQGYATLLQDKDLTVEDKKQYTNQIIDATKQLTTLTGNILKLTKLENQKLQFNYDTYRLDEQIRQSILEFEMFWSKKNLDLDLDLEEVVITSDRDLLSHVWSNLISNAIKFSNDNGTLKISLSKSNGQIVAKVTDYGIGISEENLQRIFEKFYQADKSRAKEGYGLGLAICYNIVKVLKGDIKCESKLGEYTTFTVTLKD